MYQLSMLPQAQYEKDVVYTPDPVARDIIEHFKPTGRCLDPCMGDGAFYRHLPAGSDWCEIEKGRDFFCCRQQYDWIVGNPPYTIFADWLRHSFTLGQSIVYLIPANRPFNSRKLIMDIYEYGGIAGMLILGAHREVFNENYSGWLMAAVHFQRGYRGDIKIAYR